MRNRVPLTAFVATLAIVSAGAAMAAEVFTVPVASASGFRKVGAHFVPLSTVVDLNGAGPVLIEAERPDEGVWAKGGRVVREVATAWVAGFQALRYYYRSRRPATVTLWARLRTDGSDQTLYPDGGTWTSTAREKELAGQWHWARLGDVPLKAGVHPLQIIASWPGHNHVPLDPWPHSLQIDSLVVSPDGRSPEAAAARTSHIAPGAFWLESEEFRLAAARRLLSGHVAGEASGGILEASTDGGATWRPARDLALSGHFRLRLWFPRSPGPRVRIRDFQVRVDADPERYLVLANRHVRLGVDVRSGGLFRLESPRIGVCFVAPPAAIPLFVLELKQRGKPWPKPPFVLAPGDGRLLSATVVPAGQPRAQRGRHASRGASDGRANGPLLVLQYAFLNGRLRARVTVTLRETGESLWALQLENRSGWDVLTYRFPRIAGLKVGASGYDDRWLNTSFYGPWIPGYNCFGAFHPEDRPYPGWGALGYADLFDGSAGLACATRQPEVGATSYVLRPTTPRAGETVTFEAVKEHCVASGETRAWTYAIWPHRGDWHAAADAYGAWFRQRFGAADHWPEWLRDENGWIQANSALADAYYKWPMLLDTFEEGRRMGIRHVQVWGQFGSNSCSSFAWPSPKYGPIEEFAAINRRIRDMGGHIGYYLLYDRENRYNILDTQTFEGYLPRSAYPPDVPVLSPEALIRGCMVSDPGGRVEAWPRNEQEMREFQANLARLLAAGEFTTWANSDTWPRHSMVAMNPCDKGWQDWLVRWTVDLYTRRWHCDTAYQDVLGCGNAGRSFDLRRGDHGQVYNCEMAVARRLALEGRKADPAFALSAEGKSELVTRWAAGMTSSLHYGWTDLAAHRFTHPDHILFFGGANGGYQRMAQQCELAWLYGARFDLVMTGDLDAIRRAVTFRETLKRFALRARYRDTVGVRVVAGEGIEATRHDRDDAGASTRLFTVLNRRKASGGVLEVDRLALPRGGGAFWLSDDWTVAPAALRPTNRGRTRTLIPATRLSALLVVGRARPEESILGGVLPERTPGGCRYHLWLANLVRQKRTVALSLSGPGLGARQLRVALGPYGALVRTVEGSFKLGEVESGDVVVRADGRVLAAHYVYPLVEDGSFEKSGTTVADAAQGTRVARVGAGKGWQGCFRVLNLAPGHRYRLRVAARRTGPRGDAFVLVRLKDGSGQWHHHALRFPPDARNAWTMLSAEFETPRDLAAADVYLYNHDSQDTADYDAMEVQMLK